MGLGLAAVGKRCALRGRIKPAAIEHKRQLRLHLHLALCLQTAQERQIDDQACQLVHLPHGCVLQHNGTLRQLHVVKRKPKWLRARCGGPLVQARQHIVHVVTPVAKVLEPQLRRLDLKRIHHRGQPPDRLGLDVYIKTLDTELRRGIGCIGVGHGKVVDRQFQCPGLEVHSANAHLSPKLLSQAGFQLVFNHKRQHQPGASPQQQPASHNDQQAAQPAGICQGIGVHSCQFSTH